MSRPLTAWSVVAIFLAEQRTSGVATPKTSKPSKTKRGYRKHSHWRVTVNYSDKEVSGRVYGDREKAEKFAARQKKPPFVKSALIEQID